MLTELQNLFNVLIAIVVIMAMLFIAIAIIVVCAILAIPVVVYQALTNPFSRSLR